MKISYSRHFRPTVSGRLNAIPPALALLTITLCLGGVFAFDRKTLEAPIQHLYYVPLVFAALRFGVAGGLITAVCAVVLYHCANPRLLSASYDEADILQIFIFLGVPLVTAKLADDARRLRLLASTDDLTGLSNLRGFEEQLAAMIRRAPAGSGVSMLVLDVDKLKTVNDTFGHLAGADAVRTVGRAIADALPPNGIACRYGGDEFAIAVPYTSAEARLLAETLRQQITRIAPVLAGRPMPAGTLSISAGVASRVFTNVGVQDRDEGEKLFQAADRALYVAKQTGRNRTSVAS